jgi:hypothetical protein
MEHSYFPPTNAEFEACLENAAHERSQAFAEFVVWVKNLFKGHAHPSMVSTKTV